MLQEWKAMEKPEEEEIRARLAAAKEKLAKQQLLIKEQKIPVLVLMEGWGTAGKGSVIGQVIQNIDPRFFKVESMGEKSEEECRKPFLYRYFRRIPEEGKFVFLDSGWMDEIVKDELHGKLSDEDYAKRIESVRRFERQLTDNGYLVMKFFLHIPEKEQAKRIEHLEHEKDTVWRVSKNDLWQNRHYEKCEEAFSSYMKNTNMPSAPWYIIDAKSRKWTELQVLETLTQGIEIALSNQKLAVPLLQNVFPLVRMPLLAEVPLDKEIEADEYRKELKELQKQFMPEDTKAGLIQSFLDNFKGTQVCSKLIYAEALNHPFDEPKQWEIREINEIMNNSIEGWRPFSNPRSFAKYGRQRGWERIPPPDNEPSATGSNLTDGFRELTEEEARQMELPF